MYDQNIKGLLRDDLDIFRVADIGEKFTKIFAGDLTKFYFKNGDFQYRIRYDEDYVWFNKNRRSQEIVDPLCATSWDTRCWYLPLNTVPMTMNQYIPPYGRKDRMDLANKYPIDPKDEFDYIVYYGGTGIHNRLRIYPYHDTSSIANYRFLLKE